MRKIILFFSDIIRAILDFFYPVFRRYMPLQLYRYAFTGGLNLLFDWILYFLIYNFVLQKQMLNLRIITLSSHIATFVIKFPIVLFSGFLMQKYITFSDSDIGGRIQLFRYIMVIFVNVIINYVGLKLFVEYIGLYPTPSNMIVSILTVVISYFSQKHYTFRLSSNSGLSIN